MTVAVLPIEERLLRRRTVDDSGCWNWTGHLNSSGYGHIRLRLARGIHKTSEVHRVAYEHWVGPIPAGLHIDHLCRNRACFNPAHLEPVTPAENNLRAPTCPSTINREKTHCVRGHEFTPENLYASSRARVCKTCADQRALAKRRAAGIGPRNPKMECKNGHSLADPENVRYVNGDENRRQCRACEKAAGEAYRARRSAALDTPSITPVRTSTETAA